MFVRWTSAHLYQPSSDAFSFIKSSRVTPCLPSSKDSAAPLTLEYTHNHSWFSVLGRTIFLDLGICSNNYISVYPWRTFLCATQWCWKLCIIIVWLLNEGQTVGTLPSFCNHRLLTGRTWASCLISRWYVTGVGWLGMACCTRVNIPGAVPKFLSETTLVNVLLYLQEICLGTEHRFPKMITYSIINHVPTSCHHSLSLP